MIVSWKAPEQKHPLLIKTKGKKEDAVAIKLEDLDAKKITRKVVVSPTALDDTGQLYFEIVDGPFRAGGVGMCWLHLLDTEFLEEVRYPSGSKIDKPRKDVVTVYRMEDKVVVDVDGIQYSFLSEQTADPFIKDMTDGKEMVVRLLEDMLGRKDK